MRGSPSVVPRAGIGKFVAALARAAAPWTSLAVPTAVARALVTPAR